MYQNRAPITLTGFSYINSIPTVSDGPVTATGRQQTKFNNVIGKSLGDEYMGGGYIEYMYIIPLAISDLDRNILESTYFTYGYNTAGNCWGCYSMRLAILTYTGPVINLTIGSETYNFYTDPMQTYFTTGAKNTGASLSSLMGSSYPAYVNIWYNQNGGTNHLFQTISNNRPQIASQNGKYVIQFVNTSDSIRHYLNITNGLQPNTIFSHFQPIFNNNRDSLTVLVQTEGDYSLRFAGSTSADLYIQASDWYYQSSGTKIAYVNKISSTIITMTSWNVLSASVGTPQWNNQSIHNIAYDLNNGVGNRGLNGYMVEIIFNNTTMDVVNMQQFYNNRLF
jgi:hypothetical protein